MHRLIVLALALALVFVACGNSASEPQTAAPVAPTPVVVTPVDAATVAADAADDVHYVADSWFCATSGKRAGLCAPTRDACERQIGAPCVEARERACFGWRQGASEQMLCFATLARCTEMAKVAGAGDSACLVVRKR